LVEGEPKIEVRFGQIYESANPFGVKAVAEIPPRDAPKFSRKKHTLLSEPLARCRIAQ